MGRPPIVDVTIPRRERNRIDHERVTVFVAVNRFSEPRGLQALRMLVSEKSCHMIVQRTGSLTIAFLLRRSVLHPGDAARPIHASTHLVRERTALLGT